MTRYWTPPVGALHSKRAVWLPPLVGEWWKQMTPWLLAQACIFITWNVGSRSPYLATSVTLAAVVGATAMTFPYVRNMVVWDLIAWDNKRVLPPGPLDQQRNTLPIGAAIAGGCCPGSPIGQERH